MNERKQPHYRGPELSPDIGHHYVAADLRDAASRIWTPGDQPNTFTSLRSAAGQELAAVIPPEDHVHDAPRLTLAINKPSAKVFEALSRVMAHHGRGDVLTITVLDPQEAASFNHPGVVLHLQNHGAETPLFEGELDYGMFLHFMDTAALCEPATARQRLGRWASAALAQYMEDQAKMHEAGGYRHPPSFGAW